MWPLLSHRRQIFKISFNWKVSRLIVKSVLIAAPARDFTGWWSSVSLNRPYRESGEYELPQRVASRRALERSHQVRLDIEELKKGEHPNIPRFHPQERTGLSVGRRQRRLHQSLCAGHSILFRQGAMRYLFSAAHEPDRGIIVSAMAISHQKVGHHFQSTSTQERAGIRYLPVIRTDLASPVPRVTAHDTVFLSIIGFAFIPIIASLLTSSRPA